MLIFSPRNIASIRARKPDFFGEVQQQIERFIGDAVLRIIEVNPRRLDRETLASLGVFREQLAHMQPLDLAVVRGERIPG